MDVVLVDMQPCMDALVGVSCPLGVEGSLGGLYVIYVILYLWRIP